MSRETPPRPHLTEAARRAAEERAARQAEALRANLRRRKEQGRAREAQEDQDGDRREKPSA